MSIEVADELIIFQKEDWARLFISSLSVISLLLKSSEVPGPTLMHNKSDTEKIQTVTQSAHAYQDIIWAYTKIMNDEVRIIKLFWIMCNCL